MIIYNINLSEFTNQKRSTTSNKSYILSSDLDVDIRLTKAWQTLRIAYLMDFF